MATKTEQYRALQQELLDIREQITVTMQDRKDVSDRLLRVIWDEENLEAEEMLNATLKGIKLEVDRLLEQRAVLQAAKADLDVCHACGRHD